MSEGTAVPYVRRWAITELQALSPLDGVRVSYSPIRNNADAIGDNGRIEAIYWTDADSVVEVRAFKGTPNIKYKEEATSRLVILVAANNQGDTLEDIDQRAANLLGEVIKAFQADQPPSPGTHLTNIRAFVEGWEMDVGQMSFGGSMIYATSFEVDVRIQANVEQ